MTSRPCSARSCLVLGPPLSFLGPRTLQHCDCLCTALPMFAASCATREDTANGSLHVYPPAQLAAVGTSYRTLLQPALCHQLQSTPSSQLVHACPLIVPSSRVVPAIQSPSWHFLSAILPSPADKDQILQFRPFRVRMPACRTPRRSAV